MIRLVMLSALLAAQPSQTAGKLADEPPSQDVPPSSPDAGPGAIAIRVKPVSAERALAEFMALCVRPMWNPEEIRKAVQRSEFRYVEQHDSKFPKSFRWQAPQAYLALESSFAAESGLAAQCALSMGSSQPRTRRQILMMLKPMLEAELGHDVRIDPTELTLEWHIDRHSTKRVTIAEPGDEPAQFFWLLFDDAPRNSVGRSGGQQH